MALPLSMGCVGSRDDRPTACRRGTHPAALGPVRARRNSRHRSPPAPRAVSMRSRNRALPTHLSTASPLARSGVRGPDRGGTPEALDTFGGGPGLSRTGLAARVACYEGVCVPVCHGAHHWRRAGRWSPRPATIAAPRQRGDGPRHGGIRRAGGLTAPAGRDWRRPRPGRRHHRQRPARRGRMRGGAGREHANVCDLAQAHINSDRVEATHRRSDLLERRRIPMRAGMDQLRDRFCPLRIPAGNLSALCGSLGTCASHSSDQQPRWIQNARHCYCQHRSESVVIPPV